MDLPDQPSCSSAASSVSPPASFREATPPLQHSPADEQQQQQRPQKQEKDNSDAASATANATSEAGDPTWQESASEDDDSSAGKGTATVAVSPSGGLKLFPRIGRGHARFKLGGQKTLNRAEILGEFVRRQTGQLRSAEQINARLRAIRMSTREDLKPHVTSETLPSAELYSTDWMARLGSDLYPDSQADLEAEQSEARKKRSMAVKRRSAPSDDDYRLSSTPPETGKRVKLEESLPSASANPQAFESLPHPAYIPTDFHTQPFYAPPFQQASSLPPHLPYPTLPQSSHRPIEPVLPAEPFLADSQPLPAAQLSAFLSSLLPTHDFLATAQTLYRLDLASLDALVSLLHLDANTTDAFIELLVKRGKLSGVEVGWVKKALGRAKDELDADDGAMSPAR